MASSRNLVSTIGDIDIEQQPPLQGDLQKLLHVQEIVIVDTNMCYKVTQNLFVKKHYDTNSSYATENIINMLEFLVGNIL